jgi:ribonuclease HII
MKFPHFKNELKYMAEGYSHILGCDEVGVSPLAGPVVAAACLLDHNSIGKYRSKSKWYYRVRDSKTTNEAERQKLLKEILEHTIAYGVGEVWQDEIDQLNIHKATLLAMKKATEQLLRKIPKGTAPAKMILLLDGRFTIKDLETREAIEQKCVVKGDCEILSVAAASIIAKVHRDNIMHELDAKFPEYGFASHKGYKTKKHQDAIEKCGITEFHRRSFLKDWLEKNPKLSLSSKSDQG